MIFAIAFAAAFLGMLAGVHGERIRRARSVARSRRGANARQIEALERSLQRADDELQEAYRLEDGARAIRQAVRQGDLVVLDPGGWNRDPTFAEVSFDGPEGRRFATPEQARAARLANNTPDTLVTAYNAAMKPEAVVRMGFIEPASDGAFEEAFPTHEEDAMRRDALVGAPDVLARMRAAAGRP